MLSDREFLQWVADRLVLVYGESPNVDFVLRMREIVGTLSTDPAWLKDPLNRGKLEFEAMRLELERLKQERQREEALFKACVVSAVHASCQEMRAGLLTERALQNLVERVVHAVLDGRVPVEREAYHELSRRAVRNRLERSEPWTM